MNQPTWRVDLIWTTAQWIADCWGVALSTSLFAELCVTLSMEVLASLSGAEHELAYYAASTA